MTAPVTGLIESRVLNADVNKKIYAVLYWSVQTTLLI
jgi:hypothetical protein